MVTVNLNPDSEKHNKKQREFFDLVMTVISRSQKYELLKIKIKNYSGEGDILALMQSQFEELEEIIKQDYRYFLYGGAVSGGKTIITCVILIMLCRIFPKSRWHVIRKTMPDLERTVKESISFIIGDAMEWKRTKADFYCEFKNGSRIYLMAENFDRDKDLDRFKGLMTNGVLLEQMEELQQATLYKCMERAGRWYGVKGVMPPPIILGTFNPTFGWLKKEIHDKHKLGELKTPYYYLQALPSDNPYNTDEQWRSWANMDDESYERFIKGLWEIPLKDQYFSSFSNRNIGECKIDLNETIWLSFDFNVDPMTCTMNQTDGEVWVKTIKEWRIPESDTYAMCQEIKPFIEGLEYLILVTGDASGKNRISGTRGHINHYEIIRLELGLLHKQFKVPSFNPSLSDSRMFCNSIFQHMEVCLVDESCEYTIKDLKYLEKSFDIQGNVTIKKGGVNKYLGIDNKMIGHLSDTLRYFYHQALYKWKVGHKS